MRNIQTDNKRHKSNRLSDDFFSIKTVKLIQTLLKQSALIIGILWMLSGLFKLSLLNKYSISLNFFTVDIISDFPKYTLLILIYTLFLIPYLVFRSKDLKPYISKLYLLIFGIIASFAIYLFNISSFYVLLNRYFNINLYANNFLIIAILIFTIVEYFSYISFLKLITVPNNSVKKTGFRKSIMYFASLIKLILATILATCILISSFFYMTTYKIPYANYYDIVEIDSKMYVVLLNYGEDLVVSEFSVEDQIISIMNSNYYIVSPIGAKIHEEFFLDTILDK